MDSSLGGKRAKDALSNNLSRADLACCELPIPIFSLSSSDRLPHLFPAADLDRLFPRYEAPPDNEFVTGGDDFEARQAGSSSSNPLGKMRESRGEPSFNGT